MKKHPSYVALLAGIVVASSLSGMPAACAAPAKVAATQSAATNNRSLASLPAISLQTGVSVRLTDIQLAARHASGVLTYTLTYTNQTSSPYKLINSFARVYTVQNGLVKGILIPEHKDRIMIAAGTSQSITYYVRVQNQNRLAGSKISIYGWDFNSATYEKKLGTFTVPSSYSPALPSGQSANVIVNGTPMKLQPQQLQIVNFNGKRYARLTVTVTHLGSGLLSSLPYTSYLQATGGASYPLSLDQSSRKLDIQPGETSTVQYVTAIPSALQTNNLLMQITQTNSSTDSKTDTASTAASLELPIASFKLPAASASSLTVPVAQSRKLMIDGTTIETQLRAATMSTSGNKATWTLQFRLKNTGGKTIVLPAYETAIRSAEGYTFPITTKAFASLTLKPLEEKLIQLATTVPLQLKQQQLQLQLIEPAVTAQDSGANAVPTTDTARTGTAIILPTAFYMIPYKQEQSQSIQTEYTFDNNYGSFGVTVQSVQRLPWTSDDIVVTKFTLRNSGTDAVNVPTLGGWIKTGNDRSSRSIQLIAENNNSSLGAGESRVYYAVANLDTGLDIDQLKLELAPTADVASDSTDQTAASTLDSSNPFLSLLLGQPNSAVTHIASGNAFHITTSGKKAQLNERRTLTYGVQSQKIVYTELELKNEEKHSTASSRLVAYYKTRANEYYEATVVQPEQSIGPDGKSLINVSAKLPASVNTSELTLYVGEAITDGKMATAGTTPTGYINATELTLRPQTTPIVAGVSSEMDLFPYRFALNSVTGSLNQGEDSMAINMTYSLSKDNTYTMGTYGHTLVLQWIDQNGRVQEKSFAPGTDLTLGKSIPYSLTLTSNTYKTSTGGHFTINAYDEFQGERILLGAQSYPIDFAAVIIPPTTSMQSSSNMSANNGGSHA
ncbi:hypothetical protein [Paenibacillus campi]|uniref:hypothetical protein n=1 Tax=Paenibacillus campi TaxID=3106031 RepID=UPI002AFDF1E2|nr:hypothetical protein [Paenibacillus sp. SGZ-1009]